MEEAGWQPWASAWTSSVVDWSFELWVALEQTEA